MTQNRCNRPESNNAHDRCPSQKLPDIPGLTPPDAETSGTIIRRGLVSQTGYQALSDMAVSGPVMTDHAADSIQRREGNGICPTFRNCAPS